MTFQYSDDVWSGQKRVWKEHPSGNHNLDIVIELGGEVAYPREFQDRTIQMATKGKSGSFLNPDGTITNRVLAAEPGRVILEIDPGLGKSRIATEIYKILRPQKSKVLILCSKKALNTWRRELPKWHRGLTSKHIQIVEGTPVERQMMWQDKTKTAYVVTYQSGMRDDKLWQKLGFDFVICDECKLFINRNTQAYKYWSSHLKPNKMLCVILMDGTLVKTGPQDLWPCLHIIRPSLYPSYWRFVGAFCNVWDSPFGKQILGPKNTEGLGMTLRPRFVRLKESDPKIKSQRPPLSRDKIEIDLDSQVRRIYHELCEDMLSLTPSGDIIVSGSQMGVVMKLRQLLVCPAIFDPSLGLGAAFNDFLARLEDDPHPVLFTPFKVAIPHFVAAIKSAGFKDPYILVGGTDSKEIKRVEESFNSDRGRDRVCIVTTKFAESFELYTARRCFHVGYEWAQRENYQAEKRLHRLITPHPVQSWYYCYRETVDEAIIDRLNSNQYNVNITFQDYVQYQRELDEKLAERSKQVQG